MPSSMALSWPLARGRSAPPHLWVASGALFQALGPSFAVLLFARLDVLGVAWLRIATAAVVLAVWRRPWRLLRTVTADERRALALLGIVLGLMNLCFYEAIAGLPLGTVAALEFLGPLVLAATGARNRRNALAIALAAAGVYVLTDVHLAGAPEALAFAVLNGLLYGVYIVLGHRLGAAGTAGTAARIDRLAAAMLVAALAIGPVAAVDALPALEHPLLLAAGAGIGVCSSVIVYVLDQVAMTGLPRETFALLISMRPATATAIALVVLGQRPTALELAGIALVIAGVSLHRDRRATAPTPSPTAQAGVTAAAVRVTDG